MGRRREEKFQRIQYLDKELAVLSLYHYSLPQEVSAGCSPLDLACEA
jgi:hypothetical protein